MTLRHGTLGVVVRRLLAALPNRVGSVVITFLLTRARVSASEAHVAACPFARWTAAAAVAA